MPIYKIIKIDSNTSYLIWYINESENKLLSKLELNTFEKKDLSKINDKHKRIYWLAQRIALKELLFKQGYPYYGLITAPSSKPYLYKLNINVSISYNSCFAISCVDKEKPVGIELGIPRTDLLDKRHRFLNREEKEMYTDDIQNLCLLISTKKAVYKAYEQYYLNLCNDIVIYLSYKKKFEIMKGKINRQPFISKHTIFPNYMVVWCRKLFRV